MTEVSTEVKAEAQAAYRAAWRGFLFARTEDDRDTFGLLMDSVQSQCVTTGKPGPEWQAFIATLPGFNEFWGGYRVECEEKLAVLRKRIAR